MLEKIDIAGLSVTVRKGGHFVELIPAELLSDAHWVQALHLAYQSLVHAETGEKLWPGITDPSPEMHMDMRRAYEQGDLSDDLRVTYERHFGV